MTARKPKVHARLELFAVAVWDAATNAYTYRSVRGYEVEMPGFDEWVWFVHRCSATLWRVSEGASGAFIPISGAPTRHQSINLAWWAMNDRGIDAVRKFCRAVLRRTFVAPPSGQEGSKA